MKWIIWCVLLLLSPALSHAEIYKWKDKDGSIRYSDIPPPSNIKNEPMLGNKIPKASAPPVVLDAPVKDGASSSNATPNKDEAAAKRAKDAEVQKKIEETKQAELKFRQESCATAKRNHAMYSLGGRIVTTDAQGERRFLGDEEIAKGRADAAQAIEKFCID